VASPSASWARRSASSAGQRHSYVVSSKFFWGLHDGPNSRNTLNRKYLIESVEASLERFGLDHLDLVYCHRADPQTPIEETARAMHDVIERGWALYWGTSEWTADEIRAAWDVCDRNGWHKPVVEQPQYNLFHRRRVEKEYARLYEDIGLGTTIWSPLASGLLTGKYADGIPADSRGALEGFGWLADALTDEQKNVTVKQLGSIAEELGGSLAQLAIAWCAANPNVSSVITGASKVEQVHDNMGAIALLPKLTPDVWTASTTSSAEPADSAAAHHPPLIGRPSAYPDRVWTPTTARSWNVSRSDAPA
jgi:voltage-dependent potassium channel beta subunit